MVTGVARKGKGKKGGMKSDMNGINLREEREKTDRGGGMVVMTHWIRN